MGQIGRILCRLTFHSWETNSYVVRLDSKKVDCRTDYLCRRCAKAMTFGEWYHLPEVLETANGE